ncbi:MAG: hypothetical protein AAGI25_15965 [Bacteroidota bacterium]
MYIRIQNHGEKCESLTILEFQEQFLDNQAFYDCLAKLKWLLISSFLKRLNILITAKVSWNELIIVSNVVIKILYLAATRFSIKVKFPILKALYILYCHQQAKYFSTELSHKLELGQKSCGGLNIMSWLVISNFK